MMFTLAVIFVSATTIVRAEAFAVTVTKAKDGESTTVKKLANYNHAQAIEFWEVIYVEKYYYIQVKTE